MRAKCAAWITAVTLAASVASAGATVDIWPDGAPGATGTEKTDQAILTLFPVPDAKGKTPAVLICPGGGYKHISASADIARWFNSQGIAAFSLAYRLPVHGYRHPAPLQDAQRAMRLIRSNAAQWNLEPEKIGVMGFSSGGHVASTLSTHFDSGDPQATDPVARMKCRPDFQILMCPVVTMGPFAHVPSRVRLLGPEPAPELLNSVSNELQITDRTPPTFLAHCADDGLVKVENSKLFHAALLKAGVPAELRIYEKGGHGTRGPDGKLLWLRDGAKWLSDRGITNG
ncbi:MAG: alpha/beta hydrolase [Candidatus Nealsonbacteria bacterium]|nr:alpha/beta hydrolase [Candidatus Nealsonbacteria bacterium]